jgi:hypothetical protein
MAANIYSFYEISFHIYPLIQRRRLVYLVYHGLIYLQGFKIDKTERKQREAMVQQD